MARDKICTPFLALASPEDKFTVSTIEDLQSRKYLKIGDVVELNGYYTAGDGAHHKRKIEATDDGSGVLLANGLWANIVHNGEVNVSWFGAKGDGVTDDTGFFLKTISFMGACNILQKHILIPPKIFRITEDIVFRYGDIKIYGGGTLRFDDSQSAEHIRKCLHFEGLKSPDEPVRNIVVDGIKIDMRMQRNKGGATLEDLANTSIKPAIMDGAWGISAKFVSHMTVKNCELVDVFGDGIRIERGFNITITSNKLIDCGGSGIGHGMLKDRFGDGIVCFFSKKCYVTNNFVKNTRKFKDPADYGGVVVPSGKSITDYLCGRSGLEFEYNTNTDNIENKDVSEYTDKREIGIIFDNNWVEGYAKGIHLEAGTLANISNNSIVGNYVHMMVQHVMGCPIFGNVFDGRGLPAWLQGGYHIYTNSLAISEYGGPQRDSVGNMSFIQSNRFLNGSKIMYNTYSTKILNNYFENGTIYETGTGWAGELVVENNIFLNNDLSFFSGNVAANIRNYGNNKVTIRSNSFLNTVFQKSIKNNEGLHTKPCDEFKSINLERIPDISIIEDNYFIGCSLTANANQVTGKMYIRGNLFKNYDRSIFISTQNHNCDIVRNRFHSYGDGKIIEMGNFQGRLGSIMKIMDNEFIINKPDTPPSVKYLVASNNANYENKILFNSNIITVLSDVTFDVSVFNTFWNIKYGSEVNNNVFYNIDPNRNCNLNKLMTQGSMGSGVISNGNINCKTVLTQNFSVPNGLFLHKDYTNIFERPCSDGSIGFTVTTEGVVGADAVVEKLYYSKSPQTTASQLDTPYHATKMQQEGVYDDFVQYMDEKTEYDRLQRELEKQRQLAFEQSGAENYDEWLAEQPMLMPVENEPQPSKKLLAFKEKYLG